MHCARYSIIEDYSGAPIQMRVWDDYVEIWNEGELPMGLTPEALLKKHSSHPRNKNIANAFFKAGFIESWGRGYEKIRNGFESVGLPMPIIEAVEGGVRVTFKRKNVGNSVSFYATGRTDSENTEVDTTQKTTQKTTQTIIKLIRQNPHITRKELAEKCRITVDGIKWQLQKMQERNIIRRVGADNGGCWEIVTNETK